jgi:organic hydroperoxide reductase OsmC/OhrA
MTMKVLFNGSVLVAPGGATKVDASAMANAGLSGVGVVGLVGYGDAGDDTSAHVFTDADAGREYFRGGPLADAMSWVFNPANDIRIPGGAQRVVCIMANTNVASTATLNGTGLGSGTATSTVAGPWSIPNNTAFTVKIDGGGNQTFTFTGSAATKVGSGATYTAPTNKGFKLKVNNGVEQTFTDSAGTCTNATNLALAINNQISGVAATVNGTQVDLVTDRKGSTAKIEITADVNGGLAAFGHSLGVANGSGNTPDLGAVTAADARAVIIPTGCSVTGDPLVITSSTTGGSSSVEIVSTAGATLFGFTTGVYSGNTPAASVKLTSRAKGAHTNNISYKVITSGSGRVLTLGYSDGMRSKTETSPVLGGTSEFSITYSGDATTALLNITSTGLTVTLTGQTDGSVNLNLPFATYPTVKAQPG